MAYTEADIQTAIACYNAGIFKSQRAAAKAYGIPRTTFCERLQGATDARSSHAHQQRLTPEQESFLVDWILDMDTNGYPPSHTRAREMASRILQMNGDNTPLGQLWLSHFINRNPRVASIIGRKLEASRAEAATPQQIRAFLQLFEQVRIRLGIHTEDIWNMDETGIALGVCTNSRVIASSQKKKAYKKSPENREWVSIIEAVSATGQKLRCAVIFKGYNLQTTWFPSETVPDWLYTTSENGWTSEAIGLEWLQRIYIPETATQPGRYRLLLLDGHSSHIDIEFLWQCHQNKIHLLFLPPHSTHLLQPLDLSVFSATKTRYRNQIRELASLDDAAPIKKERFITYYHAAREEGFSERVIRAGWRAAGLVPYSPEKVIQSSQILNRVSTPPPPSINIDSSSALYRTPQKPQDVYAAQKSLHRLERLPRAAHIVLQKAGKAIAIANTRAARQEAEISKLQYQLEATSSTKKRKRIAIDQNQRFADVDSIKRAIDQAAALETQISTPIAIQATAAVNRIAATTTFDSMCTVWQLE
jgi:hypothetical protein